MAIVLAGAVVESVTPHKVVGVQTTAAPAGEAPVSAVAAIRPPSTVIVAPATVPILPVRRVRMPGSFTWKTSTRDGRHPVSTGDGS